MSKKYLKIGSYSPATDMADEVIDRGPSAQGWIFKDEEAFENRPLDVCYVPENSDETYCAQDFIGLCNGQEDFARECFDSVNWQHPETWLDEQYRDNEWGFCPKCEKIYRMDGEYCVCPVCGTEPDNG